MIDLIVNLAQLIVALSVLYVWIFRFHNVLDEFAAFGLSDILRSFVGASKTVLATLLIVGIWLPNILLVSALLMGGFMIAAQYFHFRVKNSFIKSLPSLLLLILCIFITFQSI